MNKEAKKKKWDRPKLIILTRGKPEERVLDGCKIGGDIGPESALSTCATEKPDPCKNSCLSDISS